jgi:ABC-type uncharacterized transport system permease subunit
MMQGVQILNEFIHEGAVVAPWFGVGLSCCIGGVVGAFLFSMIDEIPIKIRSCAIITLISIALFGAGVCVFAPREMITRYQVIIDDGVEFNDFIDKYKIVKQDGLIYTVEERECNTG